MDKPKTAEESLKEQGKIDQGFGVKTGKEGWYGQEVQTHSSPIVDPATGRPIIIRYFDFSINPAWQGKQPSNQDLFNMHWRQIRNILWGDGLMAREDISPRIVFMVNRIYRIFITCEARFRTMVADKPTNLQEILQKKKR